jgi:peroxiredoxin
MALLRITGVGDLHREGLQARAVVVVGKDNNVHI